MTSTYTDPARPERVRIDVFEQLAAATDEFEAYSRPHASRVAKISDQLAKLFLLAAQDCLSLRVAALAHDLGEAAMRRDYIKRAGALSAEERQDIARHPVIGEQEAARAGADRSAQLLVRWHHEWWNGAGYPDALRANQIPLAARILRVADAYASLTASRPFRAAHASVEARRHLIEWAGLEFDPEVVRAFLTLNLSDEPQSDARQETVSDAPSPPHPNTVVADSFLQNALREPFSPAAQNGSRAAAPNSWLAFDLSVLRRLKFRSIALPFVGEPDLCAALAQWGVRVAASDIAQWATVKAAARFDQNRTPLSAADVEIVLEDAYVPGYQLRNQSLRNWFGEADAWWFDNVRASIDKLATEAARAQALAIGMTVGDYALSFNSVTRALRQPLSKVFRRVWETQSVAASSSQIGSSVQREPRAFIAEQHNADLLFLRLPRGRNNYQLSRHAPHAWREEWTRGEGDFWNEVETKSAGRLGAQVESKNQYLRLIEDLLQTALHIKTWAIAHTEENFISTSELIEVISHVRKVETVYTKDFSELLGVRAAIITCEYR
jgi:hypothetical protein